MKALVTGGRGFIGSFLVEHLLRRGLHVRCLLRTVDHLGWLKGLNCEILQGDVLDPDSLAAAVTGVDYIFHLAGLTRALQVRDLYRVNVQGTGNLLQAACRDASALRRFVLVSSLAAAGPSPDGEPLTEEMPAHPVSHYGKSKLEAERLARQAGEGLPVTIIRPPSVYGPRDRDIFTVFKMTAQGLRWEVGGGPRFVSLIYVEDLVEGTVLAAESEKAVGQLYYLSEAAVYAQERLAQLMAEVLGTRPRVVRVPLPLAALVATVAGGFGRLRRQPSLLNRDKFRELKQTHWVCSSEKAKAELGFQTSVPAEEGFRKTAAWYRANGWL